MSAGGGEGDRRRKLLQLGSGAAFLAIVAVAVLIVVSESQTSGGDVELEGVAAVHEELKGIPQRGMVLGRPGAAVTLVEFGDLQCPACKAYAEQVLPEVIDSEVRSGAAKLEFRNFTIIGEESETAAAAALAAAEQNRGWHFVELFYRNQGFENSGYVSDEFLASIAAAAGVSDVQTWNAMRASGRLRSRVTRESDEAQSLGLGGTPSFAVRGPGTEGLRTLGLPGSAEELRAAIAAAGRSAPE